METLIISYIIAHGYLDVIMLTIFSYNLVDYVLLSIFLGLISYFSPLFGLILFLDNTYGHFANDIYSLFNKRLKLTPSIFLGTLIKSTDINYWSYNLTQLSLSNSDKIILFLYLYVSGIYYSINLIKENYTIIVFLSILYGYIFGPYYSLLLYMINHASLSYINVIMKLNKTHIFLIIISNWFTYLTYDLFITKLIYREVKSLVIGILTTHILWNKTKK